MTAEASKAPDDLPKATHPIIRQLETILPIVALGGIVFTAFWSFAGFLIPNSLIVGDILLVVIFLVFHATTHGLMGYVLKRLMQTVFVVFTIASLTFFLLRIIPGGPFDENKALPPQVKAAIDAKYDLNAPIYKQYFGYIKGVATGHLGYSYTYVGREVSSIIAESLPASIQLGVFAMILAFLVGIPAGVFAAANHGTWKDNAIMVAATSFISIPSFLAAPILITIFCFHWNLLPVALWDGTTFYILPVIVLGLQPAAIIARLTRSSVLEVIRSDFVRTAKAKGLTQRTVLFKHVLKNSLIPVLAYAGPVTAYLLSGSFVIEDIFNIPGIGKHFIMSVTNRDYPMVLGVTLVFATMLVFANFIVDILYTYFDPKIRLT